jgi:Domain of unknown function (DUF4382)
VTSTKKTQTIFCNCWIPRIPAVLLFFAGLTGCNTCVTFTSPNGTLGIVSSDPKPACMLPKVMSAVRVRMAAEPPCSSCVGSSQVQHIFLSIRGIELHANASAQDDSPDWQELLLPELEQKPLEIDLLKSDAAQGVREPFGTTALIPAGIYHQLRLRLVPNQPSADDRLSEENMCGSGIFNCIVMADGSIHPLRLDAASPELHVMPDRMDGAALPIVSDAGADLIVEMKLMWELFPSANGGAQLVPTFISSAKVRRIELNELGTPEDGVVNGSRSRKARG